MGVFMANSGKDEQSKSADPADERSKTFITTKKTVDQRISGKDCRKVSFNRRRIEVLGQGGLKGGVRGEGIKPGS